MQEIKSVFAAVALIAVVALAPQAVVQDPAPAPAAETTNDVDLQPVTGPFSSIANRLSSRMDRLEKQNAELELSNKLFKRRADQANSIMLQRQKASFRNLINRHETDRKSFLEKLAHSRQETIRARAEALRARAELSAQRVQLAKYLAWTVLPLCATVLAFWYVPRWK